MRPLWVALALLPFAGGLALAATAQDDEVVLLQAAAGGDAELVKELLGKGVDANARTDAGLTALMFAAARGHVDVVQALLDGGAAVNETSLAGSSALMFAARGGHMEIVDALLSSGADPNAADQDGWTASMFALLGKQTAVVRVLEDAGAPQIFGEETVDEIPKQLSMPPPDYPVSLRDAGIEGEVVLGFVIDATGHVEESTIKVISSTHADFIDPAKDAVAGSVYRPGRVEGEKVRVLMMIPVRFRRHPEGMSNGEWGNGGITNDEY